MKSELTFFIHMSARAQLGIHLTVHERSDPSGEVRIVARITYLALSQEPVMYVSINPWLFIFF